MRYLFFASLLAAATADKLPVHIHAKRAIDSGVANIHVQHSSPLDGGLTYTFGSCHATGSENSHHRIASPSSQNHDRLIWIVPNNTPSTGCISAWLNGTDLVGRSAKTDVYNKRDLVKRTVVPMDNSSNIDAQGPWFDGVELLKGTNLSTVDVATAKAKDIAIVGAGMAGLMTWLCLSQAGMKNVKLIEGGQRLGGRVHTAYFGDPSERVYQEMGPMRFPKSYKNADSNQTVEIQDHKLVFDLAAELNELNGNNKNLSIDFIKWYQRSQAGLQCRGGIRKTDGSCHTLADIAANASLAAPATEMSDEAEQLYDHVLSTVFTANFTQEIATNMFNAHKHWLNNGLDKLPGDGWSEFAYMHNYLKYSLNATDEVLNLLTGASNGGLSFWSSLFEGLYFSATDWVTIDGGLNRLPSAFHPLVDNVTHLNRKVTKMSYDEESAKITLFWKDGFRNPYQNASYDYAITTVPFPVMRRWELPAFSTVRASAIANFNYDSVCKVALKFKSRFWEHFEQPIYGGCSSNTAIPGIGQICYPSYDINSTNPGVMLASYTGTDEGLRWASAPEEEHVQYVVDAMADVHGDIVYEEYTGEYSRVCWLLDPLETISWAAPTVSQRELYMPSFFKTEKRVIIGGEGSSYTSSWISSALESGVRSSVQLLLELGLVDEAKETVDKWMARWVNV